MDFKNRIVAHGNEPTDSILFHPDNWRIHPSRQADGVKSSLSSVGWVETVLINIRSGDEWPEGDRGVKTLIDGHLRVMLAAKHGQATVPVTYVDLTPKEEAYILATLDPLGALAVPDNEKLLALSAQAAELGESLATALRGAGLDTRQTFSHLTGERGKESGAESSSTATGKAKQDTSNKEKYPLAIVLNRRDYELWQGYKENSGVKDDAKALMTLLSKVVAGLEND